MIVLDTNILSELRKNKPHGAVALWFTKNPLSTCAVPAAAIYELQAGAERTRRQDRAKAAEIDAWITQVEGSVIVLPFGATEARMTAFLMRRQQQDLLMDAMIAATALTHGMTVATRNTGDFERFGVAQVNPFLFREG